MKQWRVVACKNSHEQTGNRRYDLLKLSKKFVYSHNRCLRELKEKIDFMILGLKSQVQTDFFVLQQSSLLHVLCPNNFNL